MKAISTNLKNHMAGEALTLANLWLLTRTDNVVMGFTDHDVDVPYNGVTYVAATGFIASAVRGSSGLSVDNLEVDGVLDSSAITESDLLSGVYDYASIIVSRVNWADLTMGSEILRTGRLGQVSISDGAFKAELRGIAQALTKNILEIYQPSCRAALGDTRCGVNLATYTVTGTVTSTDNSHTVGDTGRAEASGTFNGGKLTFTSGACNGLNVEVGTYTIGSLSIVLKMPRTVAIGDTYSLSRGCDKSFATCKATFSNWLNFRGEPHLPGADKLLQVGGV